MTKSVGERFALRSSLQRCEKNIPAFAIAHDLCLLLRETRKLWLLLQRFRLVTAIDHIHVVSYHKNRHVARLQFAYQDVRLVSNSSILKELGWDFFPDILPSTSNNPEASREKSENEEEHDDHTTPFLPTADINTEPNDISDPLSFEPEAPDEPSPWSLHPLLSSFLSNNSRPLEASLLDFGDTLLYKDFRATLFRITSTWHTLHSSEQRILKTVKKVIGDQPVSESKLQFALQ